MASTPEPQAESARARVLALLERHGWNATSFQIMERGFRYWFDGEDACVGYVDTGRAWVAAGPPIAPADRLAEASARFVAAAAAAGRRACLFGTEDRFREAAGWPALRIGEQPLWSPDGWDEVLRRRRSLREQLRRARAKGVTVRALSPEEVAPGHATRIELEGLIRLLAALLVIWTCVLALPWSARWFPSPAWQYGWVAFDVALCGALFALARRWRQPLADVVAIAVTADAAVTLAEALAYNAPRVRGPADVVVIAVAVLAPALAAVLLWNARNHRAPGERPAS